MIKVIEKNQHGIRVRNFTENKDCSMCKYSYKARECKIAECAPNSFYLHDYVVELLEHQCSITDIKNELLIEKAKNEAFENRIKELEEKTNICYHPYRALERNENGLFCNKCKQQVSSNQNIY